MTDKRWKSVFVKITAVAAFVLIWHLIIVLARGGNTFLTNYNLQSLPTPRETLDALIEALFPSTKGPLYQASLLEHTGASLLRVLEGFLIACLVGIPLGLLIGWNSAARDFGGTIVEILRPIPPIAWIPIGLLIFALNAPIFIVFLGIVFPIILNVVHGVRSIDKQLIEIAQTLGAKRYRLLAEVIIPSATPSLVTGMRIGLGVGWMCIVAAEMVGLRQGLGLGYYIWLAYDLYWIPSMVAGMIFIGIIGWVMNTVVVQFEKRLLRWRE
jgi:NitT/TauT family transport system permease protein